MNSPPRVAALAVAVTMALGGVAGLGGAVAPAFAEAAPRPAVSDDPDESGDGEGADGLDTSGPVDLSDSVDGAGGEAGERDGLGTVNPLSIRNPFCDQDGLRVDQRRNCEITGSPEVRYPASNYGPDVHIDTGADNIWGNFASMVAQIAGAIWTFCLSCLNLVLTVIGWAFSLSPFTDNDAMREIDAGLEAFYRAFTEPWLVVAMVAIGAWGLYRGLVRRAVSASIAGSLLSVALMLVALWVIHDPRGTIGTLAGYVNQAAMSVLAAPQSGSIANPVGDYAEATDRLWNEMTMPGFVVLNFSDADWALENPDPVLLETADQYACADAAYLSQIPKRRWQQLIEALGGPSSQLAQTLACKQAQRFAPEPRTNAEIWLRSSPGSEAREQLWEEHTDTPPYSAYFRIQGESGAGTRLPLALLIAVGLAGGILLLAWVALRLFLQSAVAFVLVLMAPLALFLPAFGERGRGGFSSWGQTLLGALVSKLVYAALLSVIVLATTVISKLVSGAGGIGQTMAFLAIAALWWAVYLSRNSLLSFLSVAPEAHEGQGRLGRMLGTAAAKAVGQRLLPSREAGHGRPGIASTAKDAAVGSAGDRRLATSAVARSELDERAGKRLDSKLAADQGLIDRQRTRRESVTALGRAQTEARKEARAERKLAGSVRDPAERQRRQDAAAAAETRAGELRERQEQVRAMIAADRPREQVATAFVSAARERERIGGRRWTKDQLAATRDAIRSESDRPVTDPAHAWRAALSPERYAALEGAERERIHGEVSDELRADRRAFGAIPDRPDGAVGPRDSRRYRRDALTRDGGEQLHAERVRATRRRRASHRRARRGLSR